MDCLIKRVKETSSEDVIIIFGKLDHESALHYLAASNIVIIPYRDTPISRIGHPNKLFEAIYFHKPIIISDLGKFQVDRRRYIYIF